MAQLKGFPARFKDSNPSECHGDGWLAHFIAARKLLLAGGIAVFCGDCGVGKTRMGYELAKVLPDRTEWHCGLTRVVPAYYITADKMLEELRQTFGNNDSDAKSERNTMGLFVSASLLVLDELDGCIKTEFGQRKLKRIIDERYMAKLPTLIITNHEPTRLKELLPKPVISRIQENGKGFLFDWPSFRTPQTP